MTETANRSNHHSDAGQEPFEAYAWRVHQALHDWTAKVDAKASVVLTLETAILGMIVVFAQSGKRLKHLSDLQTWAFGTGVFLLVCAIVLAGAAVFPQLNRREARRHWRRNHVYFGHLRRWDPAELVSALEHGVGWSALQFNRSLRFSVSQ